MKMSNENNEVKDVYVVLEITEFDFTGILETEIIHVCNDLKIANKLKRKRQKKNQISHRINQNCHCVICNEKNEKCKDYRPYNLDKECANYNDERYILYKKVRIQKFNLER